ncbi:protein kinase domain-containing protein [Novipirellula artificiosorum]|nr:protein kinase [Novipirellula artificiosorum]
MPSRQECAGTQIGRYKLLQEIGEGGMGVVFMAEQEHPVRRKVALKIIKPGMDTKQVIARFEAEEQALALMDHPNIARVLDAGSTDTGRPFFVMELVRGVPITNYCDKNQLTPTERIRLFIDVCMAVHHAHYKGIIHRDIKPSNVLISLHDGKPVVKIIDFGVAKAINQRLTERTLFTELEQLVGTPLYMSPEQAEMSGLDVDTRTDVYSLGVLLYELLTGTTPFDRDRLNSVSYDEVRRIIREVEPPKPSTRISTLGETLSTICELRKTEPNRLSLLIRGDLDWVVMKALEKDRTRRYDSAKALADDLSHYLADEPVEASPPSKTYRLKKSIRRHRLGVTYSIIAIFFIGIVSLVLYKSFLAHIDSEKAAQIAAERDRAHKESIPAIRQLLAEEKYAEAYSVARRTQKLLPDDPTLLDLWDQTAIIANVTSEPSGAQVFVRDWRDENSTWADLGTTPLERVRIPRGPLLWQFKKEGHAPLVTVRELEARGTTSVNLDSTSQLPPGTVRVVPGDDRRPFFVDKFEVTNRQFKEFVDAGGYERQEFWQHGFIDDGKKISWKEGIQRFTDSTDQLGPATWSEGGYADEMSDHPVAGVSWYEAAAYAAYAKKSLLTVEDWDLAANRTDFKYIVPYANFSGEGSQEVGVNHGIGKYEVYDIAGNVKEWCVTPNIDGLRCMRGGAWDEPDYAFGVIETHSPFARDETFGIRCAKYDELPEVVVHAEANFTPPTYVPTAQEISQFSLAFDYEKDLPLNVELVSRTAEIDGLVHETLRINTAYDGERMTLHMFLPPRRSAPFKTIVYFLGVGTRQHLRFADATRGIDWRLPASIAKSGRAVCWPEIQGTFGRQDHHVSGATADIHRTKDIFRAIDYLEKRGDIDMESLSYLGFSWGAGHGPRIAVLEDRLKSCVFLAGGLFVGPTPETSPANYAPHISIPVLMVNGAHDQHPLGKKRDLLFNRIPPSVRSRTYIDSAHANFQTSDVIDQLDAWEPTRLDAIAGTKREAVISHEGQISQLKSRSKALVQAGKYSEAEAILTEVITRQTHLLGGLHRETLNSTMELAKTVQAIPGRERDAIQLYEELLRHQREEFGEDDSDAFQTIESACTFVNNIAWEMTKDSGTTQDTHRQAVELLNRLARLRPRKTNFAFWLLARSHLKLGQPEQALAALNKSYSIDDGAWIGQWYIHCLALEAVGDRQSARDWFLACEELLPKSSPNFSEVWNLRHLAASRLNFVELADLQNVDINEQIALYDRLITQNPDNSLLYYRRGLCHCRTSNWMFASSDFADAARLRPEISFYWSALAVVSAHQENWEEYARVTGRIVPLLASENNEEFRTQGVLACLVGRNEDLPFNELMNLSSGESFRTQLARCMVHIRSGEFEKALENWPQQPDQRAPISFAFESMVHAKLGNAYSARKVLTQAKELGNRQLNTAAGPELHWQIQDRPILWCILQIALREAEAAVNTAAPITAL